MNILFACGGTGGHINPALAIAGYIKEKNPGAVINFVGNKTGMESRLVPEAGYNFYPIHISGFERKLTAHNIANNFKSFFRMFSSSVEAGRIIRELNPDVVVGTGGFACGPVLRKAHKMGIKTATHEQNAYPGLTTKLLSKYVDTVMLAMPEAEIYLPKREYTVTGNPVRTAVLDVDKAKARRALSVDNRPMILSFGGSLGARAVNEAVAELMARHAGSQRFYHFHGTGRDSYDSFIKDIKARGVDLSLCPQIRVSEYINDMDLCMAAADIVISRAGAITLSEIEAKGKASVLIPSPNVAENHQYHNAMTLKNKGAAEVIEEKDLTGELLCRTVYDLLDNSSELEQMGANAKAMAYLDANRRIYEAIMALL